MHRDDDRGAAHNRVHERSQNDSSRRNDNRFRGNATDQNIDASAEAMVVELAPSIAPAGHFRISFPDPRTEPASTLQWPSWCETLSPHRFGARARRLAPEQESAIYALAGTKSHRSLAAEFGLSQETIRAVLRQAAGV
jgi:hypothetical protein